MSFSLFEFEFQIYARLECFQIIYFSSYQQQDRIQSVQLVNLFLCSNVEQNTVNICLGNALWRRFVG